MKDKITAAIFISLALFFLINALLMPFTTEYGKYGAPGIVPIIFSTVVILLNLIMMVRKRHKKVPAQVTNQNKLLSAENKRLLISVISCLTYVFLLGHLNFIVLTSIFLSILSLIFYRKKPVLVILASVLITYGIYYIFERVFLLPLP